MSVRRSPNASNPEVVKLQNALEDLKKTAAATNAAEAPLPEAAAAPPSLDSLTPTEHSAASLGVAPEAWKPIGLCAAAPAIPPRAFTHALLTSSLVCNSMNNAHYDQASRPMRCGCYPPHPRSRQRVTHTLFC